MSVPLAGDIIRRTVPLLFTAYNDTQIIIDLTTAVVKTKILRRLSASAKLSNRRNEE